VNLSSVRGVRSWLWTGASVDCSSIQTPKFDERNGGDARNRYWFVRFWWRLVSSSGLTNDCIRRSGTATAQSAWRAGWCAFLVVSITSALFAQRGPTIHLTSPSSGWKFARGTQFVMTAQATGRVRRVRFYLGPTLLGTFSAEPYEMTIKLATKGTFDLTAVADDGDSKAATSNPVRIIVR
jgi:hypothetical protein